jgi:hypothetical protein
MTIRRGPGGMRHTIVDRPDHSRMVAYGHGRGYIQRPFAYREVVAMKGQPLNKVNLGAKTIYVYSDMKIIFMRDKVSDVQ